MLEHLAEQIVYEWLRVPHSSPLGGVLTFFIYDSVKIILLLFGMISAIGFLRTFLPEAKLKTWLSARKGVSHFFASLFGAVTPFCSCSSIPIFFGFLSAGIPLGVALSFLITSPVINEYLVVLMLGFFGWKITVAYVVSGLAIGTLAGWIIGEMKLEKYVVSDLFEHKKESKDGAPSFSFLGRIRFGFDEAVSITQKIWYWVLIGVALGAVIHNYVPSETIQGIIGKTGAFSVPIAVLIGVPMYGSCAAIVPIAVVLFEKGIPLGTALAFMMAVSALSLPEAVMLRRAMKLPLIAIFFLITTLAIITTGYLFNLLQHVLI